MFDIDNVYNGTTKSCDDNNGGCKSLELCIEDNKGKLCVPLKIAFNKEEFLMIGDTVHDSEVAKALDIDCILVARGDQHKDTLLKTGYKIFDSLGEVFIYFKERYNF